MKFAFAMAVLTIPALLQAQTPFGGFMKGKGKGDIVVSHNSESYDNVFLVPQKISGVPVFNKVQVNSINLFATFGLSNKVDLQVNLPYITATGSATQAVLDNLGFSNERKGLQDVSVYLKYNPYNVKMGSGNLSLIGAVGVQTPLGGYKVNEGLQSILAIGNRATQLNTYAMAQYKLDAGVFINGSVGYSLRTTDVPDAVVSQVKAGYAGKAFYLDAFAATQLSTSGVDILREGFTAFFPATKVNYTRLGVNLYVPIAKGVGLAGGYSVYTAGRNLGASQGASGALIYSF